MENIRESPSSGMNLKTETGRAFLKGIDEIFG